MILQGSGPQSVWLAWKSNDYRVHSAHLAKMCPEKNSVPLHFIKISDKDFMFPFMGAHSLVPLHIKLQSSSSEFFLWILTNFSIIVEKWFIEKDWEEPRFIPLFHLRSQIIYSERLEFSAPLIFSKKSCLFLRLYSPHGASYRGPSRHHSWQGNEPWRVKMKTLFTTI